MNAANQQAAEYGPAGRGGIKVPAGGAWTNVGPVPFELDPERRARQRIRHGPRAQIPRAPDQRRHRLRAEVERRPVEDHQLLASASELAADERQHPQHLRRQRRVRQESRDALPRHRRSVRSGRGRIHLQVDRRRRNLVAPASSSARPRSSPTSRSIPAARRTWSSSAPTPGCSDRSTAAPPMSPSSTAACTGASSRPAPVGWWRSATAPKRGSSARGDRPRRRGRLTATAGGVAPAGRITLAVGAPGDAVVYAFAATAGSARAEGSLSLDRWRPDVHRRSGLPAKTPVNPNDDQPNMNIMLGQAFYNHMVLVDPADAARNTVYIGGQLSSAKSTDGGATWRLVSNWLAQYRIAVRARRSSRRGDRDHQGQADPAVRR